MTDAEIFDLVRQMRAAQRQFFAARREGRNDRKMLDESRRLEREVDQALAARLSQQDVLL